MRTLLLLLLSLCLWGQSTPWAPSTFKQPYTGAVSTTQTEINKRSVSVFDFMTPAMIASVKARTKAIDCTAAIQACFTNVPDGISIYFPSGTYKVTGSSQILRTVSGDVRFEAGTLIDASTSTVANGAIFAFSGSRGTSYSQVAAITKGDLTITVHATLAATLVPGDLIAITTSPGFTGAAGDGSLWQAGGSSNWYKGEIVEVLLVAGSNVTLKGVTADGYLANTAVCAKINYVSGHFTNLCMVGGKYATPQAAVRVDYGKDITFDDGTISGFSWGCVVAWYCMGIRVDGMAMSDNYTVGGGYNYGVVLASTQSARVARCRISTGRHAITTGGNEPCRDVRVFDCDLDADPRLAVWAVDSHANTDFMSVEQCTIRNGVMMLSRNWSVKNCTVTGRNVSGIFVNSAPGTVDFAFGNIEIEGNRIYIPTNGGAGTSYPINIYTRGTIDSLVIRNNKTFSDYSPQSVQVAGYAAATLTVENTWIEDTSGYNSYGNTIYFDNGLFKNVFMRRNNVQQRNTNYHILYSATAKSNFVEIVNNFFQTTVHNGGNVVIPSTALAQTIIYTGNTYYNSFDVGYGAVKLSASSYIDFSKNLIINHSNGTDGAYILVAPDVMFGDNKLINVGTLGTILGKSFHKILSNTTTTEGIGSAVPTAGVYKLGDRILNSTGTIGQPKAWQCTTAGGAKSLTRADTTAYTLGQWVLWTSGTTISECTQAGTSGTGTAAPTTVGQVVTDGTAKFTCRSLTTVAFTSEGNL